MADLNLVDAFQCLGDRHFETIDGSGPWQIEFYKLRVSVGVATIVFLPDSTMWTLCPPNMRMVPTGFSFSSHLYKHYRL